MNDNAKAWTAALRSGTFQQTCGTLRRHTEDRSDFGPVGYCCLGVACELFRADQPDLLERINLDGDTEYRSSCDELDRGRTGLPGIVKEWLGLDSAIGIMEDHSSLAGMNDEGAAFVTIADTIEREPDGLFV